MKTLKIKKKKINTFITFLLIGLFLVMTLFPFFWMISTSFKIKGEFFTRPPIFIPDRFNFDAYRAALRSGGQKALIDSFIIAFVSMCIALILGTMGAYGLRELLKKGKNYGFWMLIIEMMPPISVVLPLFILFKYAHLLDTYPALILGNAVFVLPFAIWLLLGFLEDIPIPIEEAALIDGCSKFQVFSYIILPLLRSGLIPVAFFSFILPWNEFLMALVFSRTKVTPLTVVIPSLVMSDTVAWEQVAALSVMAIIPPVIVAMVFQRYIIRGLTFGAVKG